jgi:hypothetical protein
LALAVGGIYYGLLDGLGGGAAFFCDGMKTNGAMSVPFCFGKRINASKPMRRRSDIWKIA